MYKCIRKFDKLWVYMESQTAIDKVQLVSGISQNTVYLMGASFVFGSMITLFLLIILDWIRASNDKKNNDDIEDEK